MIGKLIKTGDHYRCSVCLICQKQIKSYCDFCGALFSNYEEVKYDLYNDINYIGRVQQDDEV